MSKYSQPGYLILYTTGGDNINQYQVRFELRPSYGYYFSQEPVDFYGFVQFVGQEQANVRLQLYQGGYRQSRLQRLHQF